MKIGNMNPIPPANSGGNSKAAQIETKIKALQAQLKDVQADDKMSPDAKEKKVKELTDTISQLEAQKAQLLQKSRSAEQKEQLQREQDSNEAEEEKDGSLQSLSKAGNPSLFVDVSV